MLTMTNQRFIVSTIAQTKKALLPSLLMATGFGGAIPVLLAGMIQNKVIKGTPTYEIPFENIKDVTMDKNLLTVATKDGNSYDYPLSENRKQFEQQIAIVFGDSSINETSKPQQMEAGIPSEKQWNSAPDYLPQPAVKEGWNYSIFLVVSVLISIVAVVSLWSIINWEEQGGQSDIFIIFVIVFGLPILSEILMLIGARKGKGSGLRIITAILAFIVGFAQMLAIVMGLYVWSSSSYVNDATIKGIFILIIIWAVIHAVWACKVERK